MLKNVNSSIVVVLTIGARYVTVGAFTKAIVLLYLYGARASVARPPSFGPFLYLYRKKQRTIRQYVAESYDPDVTSIRPEHISFRVGHIQ